MAIDWTRILDRLPPRLLFAISAAALVLLQRPAWFDLEPDLGGFRVWIAVAGLVAAFLLVGHVAGVVQAWLRRTRAANANRHYYEDRIEKLPSSHRLVLAMFFANGGRILQLMSVDPTVADLESREIISRSGSSFRSYFFHYELADWAWGVLQRRPDLIAAELGALREGRANWLTPWRP